MEHAAEISTVSDIDQPENQVGLDASAPKANPKSIEKNLDLKNPGSKSPRKNNIIIRLAKAQDLEPARAIARALHEKTVFAHNSVVG